VSKTRRPSRPSSHKGSGPWVPGYLHEKDARCHATTVREPDDPRWSPDQPDTYVRAACNMGVNHKGWHVSVDGYAWHPEDESRYVHLPTATTTGA